MTLTSIESTLLHMTEEECISALMEARWPNGFRCPRCGSASCYTVAGRRLPLFECISCRHQCSLIAGTIMERSRVPLHKWFTAIDLFARRPVSAVKLSGIIGVTYKTAWLMLHKLRDAMSRHNERDFLTGIVRFNVALSGQQSIPSLNGLHPQEHPFIIGGTMAGDKNSQVHKIMLLQDTGGDTWKGKIMLQGARKFIERHVDLSASRVDLNNILDPGPVMPVPLRKIGWDVDYSIQWVHSGIGPKHLQSYLHERAYRFNREAGREEPEEPLPGPILLRLAVSLPAPTMRAITSRTRPGRPDWSSSVDIWQMKRDYRTYAAALLPAA